MLGAISAFIATLAFSINAPLAYAAFKRGVSSQTLVAIRNVIAFIILLPLADFKISLSTLLVVMLSALLGPGLGDYAYFKAIAQSGVATAVTIGYTYIFTTQIFATALGVEHPRALTIIGALLAFIGIYIALGGRPRGLGVLYGVLASISWGAASAALGAASKDASPFTLAVIRSAVLAPLFSLFSNFSEAKKGGIIYAALSGVVGLALGSTAFIYAMSQIGVAATVIATSLTPILSQLLDRAVNKATIYPKHILGATLVGLGTAISMTNN